MRPLKAFSAVVGFETHPTPKLELDTFFSQVCSLSGMGRSHEFSWYEATTDGIDNRFDRGVYL